MNEVKMTPEEEAKLVDAQLTPAEGVRSADPFACLLCGGSILVDYMDSLNEETDWEQVLDHLNEDGKYCCYCLHKMRKDD